MLWAGRCGNAKPMSIWRCQLAAWIWALGLGCSGGDQQGALATLSKHEPPQQDSKEPKNLEKGPSPGESGPADRRELDRVQGPAVLFEPIGRPPVRVRVEIARTPAETARGLMFRRHLEADAGMLFIFPRPQHLTFWMRNTYIPLDMIFITSERRVLGVVENATPLTDDPREVPGESQYVVEVNAGFAREHGIGPGTPVRFIGVEGLEEEPKRE